MSICEICGTLKNFHEEDCVCDVINRDIVNRMTDSKPTNDFNQPLNNFSEYWLDDNIT